MLGYMRLIIREAHKHGGQGWLTYDMVFRRNNQGNSQAWNILDSSLHTAYVASQSLPLRIPCKHCNETDHSQEKCALAPTIPPVRTSHRKQFPSGSCLYKRPPPSSTSQPSSKRLCISWNRGQCGFPRACTYRHSCAICGSTEHKARDCAHTPTDSLYKLPPRHNSAQQSPL